MPWKTKEKQKEYRRKVLLYKKQYDRERYLKERELRVAYSKVYNQICRNTFLTLYGNKCICCGETQEEFLTIDHINGQTGKKKEDSRVAYRKAVDEFPSKNYQILCMNCNHSFGVYGYCPHGGNNV